MTPLRLALAPLLALAAAASAQPATWGEEGPPREPAANGISATDMLLAMQRGISPLAADELARRIAWAARHPLGSELNPVRAEMPEGERAYIGRLRCADGRPPALGERRNVGHGIYVAVVDVYPLDCGDAAPGRVDLHMDMYHAGHVETEAPPGFTLEGAE